MSSRLAALLCALAACNPTAPTPPPGPDPSQPPPAARQDRCPDPVEGVGLLCTVEGQACAAQTQDQELKCTGGHWHVMPAETPPCCKK